MVASERKPGNSLIWIGIVLLAAASIAWLVGLIAN
jgi:hypothetical protein